MQQDFLRDIGYLGVTARLKRLSDSISYNIKTLYREQGLDIEPSWHLIFLWLEQEGTSTMSEIAAAMHYSQPAVTKMLNKIEARGYLTIHTDPDDQRRRLIQLSRKAKAQLPQFKQVWQAGQEVIEEMLCQNQSFIPGLAAFEDQQEKQAFTARVLGRL
ncbi:MAG: MarR family transcriptional regulator [Saprospiraceae bacterium]|nr:MarR family transcriptional regulator [Saprospiraceae bacterium]